MTNLPHLSYEAGAISGNMMLELFRKNKILPDGVEIDFSAMDNTFTP
jgi:hypothetical protein